MADPRAEALDLVSGLILESGHAWAEVATPEQWADMKAVLDTDSKTPYHYITRARGYSKTGDIGAASVAVLLTQAPAQSRLYGLASDRDQGGLLLDAIRGYVSRTPTLSSALKVEQFQVTATRSGSTLNILAADAASSYGLKPYWAVIDELGQWATSAEPKRLFDAVTSALAKVKNSRAVVITSASSPSHWSYRLLEIARRDPIWRTSEIEGPAPWTDPARLAEQKRRLPASIYARLFGNVWAESEDRLSNLSDLHDAVKLDGPLVPKAGRQYVVGVDLGLVRDRSVAAVCHLETHDDKPIVVLDRMEVWQGRRNKPVQLSTVEAWIVQASAAFFRPRVRFDIWQAAGLVQRLQSHGVRTEEYPFNTGSVSRLAITIHNLIRDHALWLPDDAELIDELSNIHLTEGSPGVFRLAHDRDKFNDRVIALALAAHALVEKAPQESQTSMEFMRNLTLPDFGSANDLLPIAGRFPAAGGPA